MAGHELRGNRAVGAADLTAGGWGSPEGERPTREVDPVVCLERIVMSLAVEGGPRERELLDRANLLETHLGKVSDREAQWWSQPAGGVVELVVADARGTDVDAAALVAPLVAPQLLRAADQHRDQLLASPPPSESVTLVGTTVTVTPDDDGAAAADQAQRRYLDQPIPGPQLWLVGALAGLALVFVVLALVTSPGWWVLVVGLAIGAAAAYLAPLRRASDERARREQTIHRFTSALEQARQKVRQGAASLEVSRETVHHGHAAMTRSLEKIAPAAR
ncbi:hypothetical protein [Litorihabitans aurantiacus]|uniref:Pterin-binding domain-containing protein n=1 Tax=Litorihabitans aurantiacus TaxID=1930061 RepID=A0AA38CVG3_9MICO|nr:hypothetical protein [Litorihabitans aurantiacus]GMA32905.1 hypothetical protein GCM10025875_28970 [Litorihabitans aurantiacus]